MHSLAPALTLTLTQTFTLNHLANKQLRSSHSLYSQGRIEPPKAARGHATYIGGKMLSVTEYSFQTYFWCRRTTCPPGPAVPPDQLSPRTCGPRTSCPPGHVVLGPNVPCQDRMSPHRKVPASLSSDGKLGAVA